MNQQIAIIQLYIFHRRGVEVNITPDLPREIPKVMVAYNIASNWLNKNNVKITRL